MIFLPLQQFIAEMNFIISSNKKPKKMKSTLFFCGVLFVAMNLTGYSQEVNIPDNNFKAALLASGVDTSGNGEISYAEADAVTTIDVNSKDIEDLTGIEAFVNLTVLNCYFNQLTSINLSKNTDLLELRCFGNKLSWIDVSKNTDLIKFMCYDNLLDSIDVSNNPQLTHLYCGNSGLTSLDVSNNTQLLYLYCERNAITILDLSGNTVLKELICYVNQLSALDVSICPDLTLIRCYSNQLDALDVSKNPLLKDLMCSDNLLTEIDISNNPDLTTFLCDYNQFTSLYMANNVLLKSIGLSGMPNLTDVCVWALPFPVEGVTVDTTYSPNIVYSTSCISALEKNITNDNKIIVYPVPAHEAIYIYIKGISEYSLEIIDIQGKTVYSYKNYYNNKEIDVGSLSKGVYILQVKTGTENLIKKLFIR